MLDDKSRRAACGPSRSKKLCRVGKRSNSCGLMSCVFVVRKNTRRLRNAAVGLIWRSYQTTLNFSLYLIPTSSEISPYSNIFVPAVRRGFLLASTIGQSPSLSYVTGGRRLGQKLPLLRTES